MAQKPALGRDTRARSRRALPLVSCIMPTADRRAHVPSAIAHFLAQDYPRKELVILDDGDDAVQDLIPPNPAVRYFRSQPRAVLGEKRNRLCALSRGEIIVHWDDDDWHAPGRLSYQVGSLLGSDAMLCGITRPLFLDPVARRAWEYVYPASGRSWLSGSTLCYRREAALRRPFRPVAVGEDAHFVAGFDRRRVLVLEDNRFHVGLIHPDNASPKRPARPRWRSIDPERIFSLMEAANPGTGANGPGEAQAVHQPGPSALVASAYGLGDVLRSTPLVRALQRLGYVVDVLVAPDHPDTPALLDDRRYVRRVLYYPDFRANRGAAPLPALQDTTYDIAVFSHWARPLLRHVGAERVLVTDPDDWLRLGDHSCNTLLAKQLGWSDRQLPEAFAVPSDRRFALPPGTVALHPGCKPDWHWKKWHGFADVAERLRSVVVVGSEADRDTGATYFRAPYAWPAHVRDFTGQLSLPDTAALLSQCAAVVANDSGIMQLATALGVPTVAVFGITSPARELMPQANVQPISKGLPCEAACRRRPWGRRDCEHGLKCLKALTADEVVDSMSSVLRRPTARAARSRKQRPASEPDQLTLTYYGYVFDASGYGRAARAYIHALTRVGVAVTVVDLGSRPRQVQDDLVASLLGPPTDSDLHLFHGIPAQWARLAFPRRNTIGMTVWETDTLPGQWRNALNHTLDVWVPSRFNVECFRAGLERPVFQLPHPVHEPATTGADAPQDVQDWLGVADDTFVFYSIFEWQERKNPEGLLEAFLRAFPHADGPVLVLKTNPGARAVAQETLDGVRGRLDSSARVLLRCEAWSDAQITGLHARGNCYVSLHLGEGWGYPVFDAAARGVPVIATAYSGPLDFLGTDHPGLVPWDPVAVRQPYVYYAARMKWAQPRLDAAIDRLRWTYEHQQDAQRCARDVQARIQQTYALEAIGHAAKERLLEVLCRVNPRRAQRLRARLLGHALEPTKPIPGSWYDADYFEHGLKSNWRDGYSWQSFEGLFRDTARFLIEVFADAESFLDVGCAKGFLVRTLRESGKDAWGCDHSAFAIAHADETTRPHLIERCATRLQPDRRFDVTVAMNLLESLTEDQARTFLSAARRWTRQALVAVVQTTEAGPSEPDSDLSRVIRRPHSWWQQLFVDCGWQQDALHRVAARSCQAHPLPTRMGWQLFVFSPGAAPAAPAPRS
jgi:ADP-heptose:LPS heptosyltransferase/2-polyprenyl-3-methyl-5-hydroxy-6-metoxy-1,4-benzoquinol methylase